MAFADAKKVLMKKPHSSAIGSVQLVDEMRMAAAVTSSIFLRAPVVPNGDGHARHYDGLRKDSEGEEVDMRSKFLRLNLERGGSCRAFVDMVPDGYNYNKTPRSVSPSTRDNKNMAKAFLGRLNI